MTLYLCHTPLHLLISLLVYQTDGESSATFAVMQDSPDLHALAEKLLKDTDVQLLRLPGAASCSSKLRYTLLQISNTRLLRKQLINRPHTVYIFHDLRPESQALLNYRYRGCRPNFVCLEDGTALYDIKSLIPFSRTAILKRKVIFGHTWRHAPQIGLHPAISEVRCFYPQFIRENLRSKRIEALPNFSILEPLLSRMADPLNLDGKALRLAVIVCPHSDAVSILYMEEFIAHAVAFCQKHALRPLIKLHPRDLRSHSYMRTQYPKILQLPHTLPVELLLVLEKKIVTVLGARTSALHIIQFLRPELHCSYYERSNCSAGIEWKEFYKKMGIASIPHEHL